MQNSTSGAAGMTIVRTLPFPKEAVFHALSDADALGQWWGPAGSQMTVLSFEFRPGGIFHYRLDNAGMSMWGRFVYSAIAPPDSIAFTSSFADEHGEVTKSPFPIDFPLEVSNRLTLEEAGGVTTLTLAGHPINATETQEAIYRSIIPSMEQGFAGTFNQLEEYLGRR